MPDVQTTSRTGIAPPDWEQMAETARLVLAQDPPPDQWLVATAHLCAAAKAHGRPEDAARAAANLGDALARHGLTLKTAAVQFGAIPAAIAIITATGDLAGARNFFHRVFRRPGESQDEIVISDTADIADWARREGHPFTVVEPESHVTLDAGAHGLSPQHYTAAPFVSAVVPGGEIFAGWDFARTPGGTVLGLGESGEFYGIGAKPFFHLYSDLARTVVHYWPSQIVDVPEAALFLPAPFRMHPGHWIVDGLPRLAALAGHPEFKVAVPDRLPARQRELLAVFGVTPDRIIDCKMGVRYRFRELLVAQYDNSIRPSPGKIRFIADHLRKPRTDTPPRRVFVVRGVPTRQPANQDEVDATLAAFGFVSANLMTMSNAEQRDCFAAADIVVTTYGSDLLVCYFMQPGTDLIEFNWSIAFDGPGAPACNFIGIDYHLLMCRPAESAAKVNKKDSDFVVDCAALRRLLERIIAAKA